MQYAGICIYQQMQELISFLVSPLAQSMLLKQTRNLGVKEMDFPFVIIFNYLTRYMDLYIESNKLFVEDPNHSSLGM